MASSTQQLDPVLLRQDFPILQQSIHRDRPLVFLDNAASTQRPEAVLQAMDRLYHEDYANVHRGLHWLSEQASAHYEQARRTVQRFIGAAAAEEVIFTSGTTAAINLVARAWGDANLRAGDEILLTLMEHHSNIVPWQQLAQRTGAVVRFAGLDAEGRLDLEDLRSQLNERTAMVAVTAVSNVLGTLVPVADVVAAARSVGATTLIDAAQQVPHGPVNVREWDADFVAFSGHKMLGPTGVGVLWGRREVLEAMPPFLGGGSMIDQCTIEGFTPGELPARFEAGTPPIAEAIGLAAAIEYLQAVGLEAIERHESQLVQAACQGLSTIDGLEIIGPPADERAGLLSFFVEGVSAQDLAILLDQQGVAIRAGHHCAMPLHQHLALRSTCRASFYLYNTEDEVQRLVDATRAVVQRLR